MTTLRSEHEIEHGKFLAANDAERIWGWGTPAGKLRAQRRAEMIVRGARLTSGMKVLEVGCGTGLFSELISKLVPGLHIVAVDISPELIDQAKQRGLPPGQVEFVVARFEDCQLLGPFDAVVGSSILHHLDVADALAKMRALLRSRGTLSFAEPNMLNPQIAIQKNVGFIKRRLGDSPDETAFTRRGLKRLLEQAGFVDVHVTPFDWLHPLTPRPLIPLVRTMGRAVEHVPLLREFAGSVVCSATAP